MLVLALDTATSTVTAGVVELPPAGAPVVRAERVSADARKHGELLMPNVLAACAEAGVALRDVDAIVTGAGPGPFTGLRVGMVTAAALGDALGKPVHGVCSHDAIAREACAQRLSGNLLVVTDARRREVYWAGYDAEGARITGPHVEAPAVLVERLAGFPSVAAAGEKAEVTGLPVVGPATPGVTGLVAVAADALRSGAEPGPVRPLYLRRPDAVEPGARKRVSA
ncbi:tRNA (adenosine(37)-N6)-threonylcarbamoyltransferase complex dimerization subunit type 1 TsaB [Pseudonocardia sp. N23]|uniref:tRNA (adenosine(37)-N6)-threonylcarbamoyltransferase complex dimerization subunit type 1 TsaB n=1 Tax=Pseudonocardia sp. N23 TaxID=1987376 RepID=UPI000BFC2B6A|nr:tRNA (adenosine(37)-N6)-threonylcarbamoyltransferase complex dimerization subunit type 1 TsaB [Pseudonocardia sp. N23]GAY10145.1 TsaB protein [Pseudonocardia sp. N23]